MKKYSPKFKFDAVCEVLVEGRPALEVAKRLEIARSTLFKWVQETKADKTAMALVAGKRRDNAKDVSLPTKGNIVRPRRKSARVASAPKAQDEFFGYMRLAPIVGLLDGLTIETARRLFGAALILKGLAEAVDLPTKRFDVLSSTVRADVR